MRNETLKMLSRYVETGMTPAAVRFEMVRLLPPSHNAIFAAVHMAQCRTCEDIAAITKQPLNQCGTFLKDLTDIGLLRRHKQDGTNAYEYEVNT